MFETLDRLMLAGLGALTMTREKAETMFDEYVSKGQTVRETRTGFVKDVMDMPSGRGRSRETGRRPGSPDDRRHAPGEQG